MADAAEELVAAAVSAGVSAAEVTGFARVALSLFSGLANLNELIQQYLTESDLRTSIHVTNRSKKYILVNPQVYYASGTCYSSPQPTVNKEVTEICSFFNTPGSGVAGVLTYDVADEQRNAKERLAIMFSVLYNDSKNGLTGGFFDTDRACDSSLFNLMHNDVETFRRMQAQRYNRRCIVRGALTPMSKSVMKIELWDA